MNSNKISLKLFIVVLICIGVSACFQERSRLYKGGPKVAWFNSHEESAKLVQTDTTIILKAEIIGHQRNNDLTVDVSVIDTVNSGAETGKPYKLSSSSITIPADSSTALFPVQILASNVKKGETVPVLIKLKDGNGVKADPNIGTYHLEIANTQ
jgi:copper(I)-binding protein